MRSRHFPRQVMSLSRPLPHHVKLRPSSDWQSRGSYLMTIGRGRRAQEVTAWFPQSHPCEKQTLVNKGSADICVCSCGYPCHIFNKYVRTYVTELLCCTDSFTIGGRVFLHTTETLRLWPLTLWQPWGLCLSDLTCSNWPTNYLTLLCKILLQGSIFH